MKKHLLYLCCMVLAVTACQKTKPDVNDNNPSPEPVVKKYLVKQLLNDEPERIMLAIDWNDDFSKVLHVKHGLGYGSILDYDFKYYGEDSIRILLSMPPESYPMWCFWYDSLMIHMRQNKIDSICCYANGILSDIEHYSYNDEDKIIKREYLGSQSDFFEWEGDDVVKYSMCGTYYGTLNTNSFTRFIHPYYTLPFYLSNEVAFEVRQPLLYPIWKHQPVLRDNVSFEADTDGYVTKMAYENSYFITYYYTIHNNSN